jgi:hypothetical protein
MVNLVGRIRDSLPDGCIASGRLRKEGCSVSLKNAPAPWVAVDMDKPQAPVGDNETKCDYIFIGGCDDVYLVPLELKRGKLDASTIVKQLRAGANIAGDRIIPMRAQVQFLPVAVCGGKIHRAEIRRLLQSRIRFRSQNSTVRLLKCNDQLIKALSKEI